MTDTRALAISILGGALVWWFVARRDAPVGQVIAPEPKTAPRDLPLTAEREAEEARRESQRIKDATVTLDEVTISEPLPDRQFVMVDGLRFWSSTLQDQIAARLRKLLAVELGERGAMMRPDSAEVVLFETDLGADTWVEEKLRQGFKVASTVTFLDGTGDREKLIAIKPGELTSQILGTSLALLPEGF